MEQQRPWTVLGHAFVAGEAALVPELEGEADEGCPWRVQQRGDGGGVDSAGHGYGDEVGLHRKVHLCKMIVSGVPGGEIGKTGADGTAGLRVDWCANEVPMEKRFPIDKEAVRWEALGAALSWAWRARWAWRPSTTTSRCCW
jgi:hypothetical protein